MTGSFSCKSSSFGHPVTIDWALNSCIDGDVGCALQVLQMWASGPTSNNVPADFLAICQIAATQQLRQELFLGSIDEVGEDS
jgi:hypothetical protein